MYTNYILCEIEIASIKLAYSIIQILHQNYDNCGGGSTFQRKIVRLKK